MSVPAVSAVVCTHGRVANLPDALASLARQTLAPSRYEIVVVDNASRDETQSYLAAASARRPDLRVAFEPVLGLNHARNLGWREARAPLVAFVDDDARAHPDWLASYVDYFAAAPPEVAAAGGPVLPVWASRRAEPPRWLRPPFLRTLSIVDLGPDSRALGGEEWIAGTNMCFRRSALEALGGFHTGIGRRGDSLLSGDEIHLFRRLRARGAAVHWVAGASVDHVISGDRLTRAWMLRRYYAQGRSDAMLAAMAEPGSATAPPPRPSFPARLSAKLRRDGAPSAFELLCMAAERAGRLRGGKGD